MYVREFIFVVIGAVGGIISSLLGGWDYPLQALVALMSVDYVTGWICAGVFKKSRKSRYGALDSCASFRGLIKKGIMLLLVLVGYQLDYVLGADFVRYAVIIAFIANEALSIIENAGLMGIPLPQILKQAVEILKKEGDKK
ncbi:MAG: phage holin family protein [Defluviitaleaceae bacterium]|nr:phage holin family protein [Defluviitaleaceae bacterium]